MSFRSSHPNYTTRLLFCQIYGKIKAKRDPNERRQHVKVTISKLKAINVCYSDEKLEALVNGGMSVDEALELDIPAKDIVWCTMRGPWLTAREKQMLTCDFAEHVAHHNSDPSAQNCIDVTRKFLDGNATREELMEARDAAYAADAADAAAADAVASAAFHAFHAAYAADAAAHASAAYASAAYAAAAYAAERSWQLSRIKEVWKEKKHV
jgi:hypothetical protein